MRDYILDKRTKKASDLGYNARSVFKLEELDNKYHLVKPGLRVLDLGSSPGSFIQYCRQRVGADGVIIGCDLTDIPAYSKPQQDPFTLSFTCDLMSPEPEFEEGLAKIANRYFPQQTPLQFDLLLSDAMTKTSGIAFLDHEESVDLVLRAFEIASHTLKPGANFVAKFFSGERERELSLEGHKLFKKVHVERLAASNRSKKEHFIVCLDKIG